MKTGYWKILQAVPGTVSDNRERKVSVTGTPPLFIKGFPFSDNRPGHFPPMGGKGLSENGSSDNRPTREVRKSAATAAAIIILACRRAATDPAPRDAFQTPAPPPPAETFSWQSRQEFNGRKGHHPTHPHTEI